MTVEDPDELDRCSSLFTVAAYVVANLDEKLPREGAYPSDGLPPNSAPYIPNRLTVITAIIYMFFKIFNP